MICKTKLHLQPYGFHNWQLMRDMKYEYEKVRYTVPKGFIFNGVSIPRIFFTITSDEGVKLYAACLHDFLYQTRLVNKRLADKIFKDILIEVGEPKIVAYVFYFLVSVFGWFGYYRYGEHR